MDWSDLQSLTDKGMEFVVGKLTEFLEREGGDEGSKWVRTRDTNIKIGDRVRFQKGRGWRATRRTGKVVRETPSGYLVIDIDNSSEYKRFKPGSTQYGRYFDVKTDLSQIQIS